MYGGTFGGLSAGAFRTTGIAREPDKYAVGQSYTGPQTQRIAITGQVDHQAAINSNQYIDTQIDFAKSRAMRRDPTISLARLIAIAPVLMVDWDYVLTEPDLDQTWADFCKKFVDPVRRRFMRAALFGEFDYGWKAFEKIYTVSNTPEFGQRVIHKKLKPLKNDDTWEVLDVNGDFDGVIHRLKYPYMGFVRINKSHSIMVNFNDDETGEYAEPIIARAESSYDEWNAANAVAKRFDEKVAGALWCIEYPEGFEPLYMGERNVDRSRIADDIIKSIKATGYLKIPSQLNFNAATEQLQNLGISTKGWKLSLIESQSKAGDLVPRLDYLDKLKARACGVLERTMMEGNYGTKAEAESHLNVMLLAMGLKLADIAEVLNDEINILLEINYGVRDVVRAHPQAIVGNQKEHLMAVLGQLMGTELGADIAERVDLDTMLDQLDVPTMSEEEIQEQQENRAGGMMDILRNAMGTNGEPQQNGAPTGLARKTFSIDENSLRIHLSNEVECSGESCEHYATCLSNGPVQMNCGVGKEGFTSGNKCQDGGGGGGKPAKKPKKAKKPKYTIQQADTKLQEKGYTITSQAGHDLKEQKTYYNVKQPDGSTKKMDTDEIHSIIDSKAPNAPSSAPSVPKPAPSSAPSAAAPTPDKDRTAARKRTAAATAKESRQMEARRKLADPQAGITGNDGAEAVKAYTSDEHYSKVNQSLRDGADISQVPPKPHMQHLNHLAQQPLAKPTTVYRGIGDDAFKKQFAGLEAGSEIEMKGMVSTSLSPEIAGSFSDSTMLEIKAKRGLPVNDYSEFANEYEIVQAHGTKYRFIGIEEKAQIGKDSMRIIQLEEI